MFSSDVRRSIVWVAIFQYSAFFFPLVVTPVLARSFGVAIFGTYSISIAYISVLSLVVEFGLNAAGARLIAITEDAESKSKIVSAIYITRLSGFLLVLFFIFVFFNYLVPNEDLKQLMYVGCIGLLASCLSPIWYLQGVGRSSLAAWPNLASRLICLPLIFWLVKSKDDLMIGAALVAMPQLLTAIVNIWQAWGVGLRISMPNRLLIKSVALSGIGIFGTLIFIQVYTNINIILAANYLSEAEIANFSSADRVTKIFFMIVAPLTSVLFPYISKLTTSSKSATKSAFDKVLFIHIVLASLFFLGVYFFSSLIIKILYGTDFVDGGRLLKMFSFFPVVAITTHCIGVHGLTAGGKSYYFMLSTIIGGIFSIATLPSLVKIFLVDGMIYSAYLTELVVLLVAAYFYAIKISKNN